METTKLTGNISYRYFNVEGSKGVVTIALADPKERDYFSYYGVAFCSPKDQFVKKIARSISSGRLLKNINCKNYRGCYAGKVLKQNFDEAFLEVISFLQNQYIHLIPRWAKGKDFKVRGRKGE